MFQDVVILNKVDMVPGEGSDTLEDLEKEIHKINSIAEIIRTVRCQVDLSKILDRRAYDSGVSKPLSSSISLYMKTSAGLISFRFFFFVPPSVCHSLGKPAARKPTTLCEQNSWQWCKNLVHLRGTKDWFGQGENAFVCLPILFLLNPKHCAVTHPQFHLICSVASPIPPSSINCVCIFEFFIYFYPYCIFSVCFVFLSC